nr:MAG TPA: protein of unknown function (DUF4713) [Caudoviricetes sp.]
MFDTARGLAAAVCMGLIAAAMCVAVRATAICSTHPPGVLLLRHPPVLCFCRLLLSAALLCVRHPPGGLAAPSVGCLTASVLCRAALRYFDTPRGHSCCCCCCCCGCVRGLLCNSFCLTSQHTDKIDTRTKKMYRVCTAWQTTAQGDEVRTQEAV